jgi:hypothetical protein
MAVCHVTTSSRNQSRLFGLTYTERGNFPARSNLYNVVRETGTSSSTMRRHHGAQCEVIVFAVVIAHGQLDVW